MKQIGIISDTHDYLDDKIFKHFENCDEIWHAGDVGNISILKKMADFKPLKAVYGNIDGTEIRNEYPEELFFDCEGLKVLLIHIGGSPSKYPARALQSIKEKKPDLYVCGHSHILRIETDKTYKMLYMNPGAAGKHGFHTVRTIVRLKIEDGKMFDIQVIELGKRASII